MGLRPFDPIEEPLGLGRSSRKYLNRELSWLDFNRRVLALAEDPRLPLLERAKFLAIFSTNLDEFFQIRVALLLAEVESGLGVTSADGLSAEQQLVAIRERVTELTRLEQEVFSKELVPELAHEGIRICSWNELDDAEQRSLSRVFEERMYPVLTPLAVDPAHPFPYVSNLSFNIAAMVRDPDSRMLRFARIKVPPLLERFFPVPDSDAFLPVEQLISARLDRLFPGMQIEAACPFRVTRDADLDIREDDAEDLLVAIESGLQRQRRRSDAVRLEVDDSMSERGRALLTDELELDAVDVYLRTGLIDLGSLWSFYALDRPDLKYEPWVPRNVFRGSPGPSERDGDGDVFSILRKGDVLVHHPYDSFASSVETFLRQAASDPNVLAIKHTIYRSSGPESAIARLLSRAAQSGKQVVALVELKARFDEATNIEWARVLEQAGVHVVYGLVGLKTHAKTVLVVRQEADGIHRYCHIGTGNYNPATARLYEDVGMFSASPALCADIADLFNQLTGFGRARPFRKLLVAPEGLRSGIIAQIEREIAEPDGRIVIKVNNLSDPAVIDALYQASQSGVEIDLIVRGICCLRAGVPGLSERIRVRSIVGRFLEHSRVYAFGRGERRRFFFGSADLMPRNLDHRVEAVTPVEGEAQGLRLEEILDLCLFDVELAWELQDSTWQRISGPGSGGEGRNAQEELQRATRKRGVEE